MVSLIWLLDIFIEINLKIFKRVFDVKLLFQNCLKGTIFNDSLLYSLFGVHSISNSIYLLKSEGYTALALVDFNIAFPQL